jgi:phage gp29-like protein
MNEKTKVEKVNLYTELGVTGLNRYSGIVDEEFLNDLKGTRGIKMYKEMSNNDPTIGAFLRAIKSLVDQVEWRVESEGSTKADLKAKAFIKESFERIKFDSLISEILSVIVYGWAWFEKVYTKEDGMICWKKWSLRSQDSLVDWEFTDRGDVIGLNQQAPPTYELVYIPKSKSIHFVVDIYKSNPEGKSLLRNAYEPYFYKKNLSKIEAIGIERDMVGMPVIWVPANIINGVTSDDITAREAYKKLITSIRVDDQMGVMMPLEYDENGNKVYDLSLLQSGGKKAIDTTPIINRFKADILMSVLADFLQLGHDKVGSFALGSSKTDMFVLSLNSLLKNISCTIEDQAIKELLELNAMEVTYPIKFNYSDIESADLGILGDFVNKVSSAGFLTPDFVTENALREAADLPLKVEGESNYNVPTTTENPNNVTNTNIDYGMSRDSTSASTSDSIKNKANLVNKEYMEGRKEFIENAKKLLKNIVDTGENI